MRGGHVSKAALRSSAPACGAQTPGCSSRWLLGVSAGKPGAGAAPYPATIAAMQSARRDREQRSTTNYTEFARRAQQEGYRGVGPIWLHRLVPPSESGAPPPTSARSSRRLNVDWHDHEAHGSRWGSTRREPDPCRDGEMHRLRPSIRNSLEQLKPEANEEAITLVRYAWASEQQHRDKHQADPALDEHVVRDGRTHDR